MSDSESPTKKPKKWYKQQFKEEWLDVPALKSWLKPDDGNKFSAICVVCDCKLKNPNKSALLAHRKTAKHLRLCNGNIKEDLLDSGNDEDLTYADDRTYHDAGVVDGGGCRQMLPAVSHEKVAKAELLLSAFVTEYSMSLSQAERLVEVIKRMCPDSAIAQALNISKIRASCSGVASASESKAEYINHSREENHFPATHGDPTRLAIHGVEVTEEIQGALTALKTKLSSLSERLNSVDDYPSVIECLKAMSSVGVVIERYQTIL